MADLFIKKYWEEENIVFFIHFRDKIAIRQIEVSDIDKTYLDLDNPIKGDSMLYDQDVGDLNLNEDDYISEEKFNEEWNRHDNIYRERQYF